VWTGVTRDTMPIPDSCTAANDVTGCEDSFDHLIGGHGQAGRQGQAEHPGGLGFDDEFEPARLHDRQVRRFGTLEDAASIDALRPRPLIARPPPRRRASIELLNEKEPRRGSDQALSGRRRGAYCTRNVDPMALPQASSAFRSVVCENIPNIAPHIAANIRMGIVCLRLHSERTCGMNVVLCGNFPQEKQGHD
jgi:hypothetical protein